MRQEAEARLRVREGRGVKEVASLGQKKGSHRYAQNGGRRWRCLPVSEHIRRAGRQVWMALSLQWYSLA